MVRCMTDSTASAVDDSHTDFLSRLKDATANTKAGPWYELPRGRVAKHDLTLQGVTLQYAYVPTERLSI